MTTSLWEIFSTFGVFRSLDLRNLEVSQTSHPKAFRAVSHNLVMSVVWETTIMRDRHHSCNFLGGRLLRHVHFPLALSVMARKLKASAIPFPAQIFRRQTNRTADLPISEVSQLDMSRMRFKAVLQESGETPMIFWIVFNCLQATA